MNNDQNHNQSQTKKPRKKKVIVIVSIIVTVLLGCTITSAISNNESTDSEETTNIEDNNFYVGETMKYDNVDVTVDSISETQYSQSSNNENGYIIKVTFTLKNNRTEEFSVSDDCFTIRTEDKNEKYTSEQFLFYRSIIAGGQETYSLEFKVPYSMAEKNYIMYFDWGWWYTEQAYCLYNRDGTSVISRSEESDTMVESNDSEEDYGYLFDSPCPITIDVEYHTSKQSLIISVTNDSDKQIKAIKYMVIVYDAYGEVVKKYDYGATEISLTYDSRALNSHDSSLGKWTLNGFEDGRSLDIYIYDVYYSDGSEWGSREITVDGIKAYATKIHKEGTY